MSYFKKIKYCPFKQENVEKGRMSTSAYYECPIANYIRCLGEDVCPIMKK